ncbi:glycosyltransferase family 2 protein [Pseudochelatococcus sp. B33]
MSSTEKNDVARRRQRKSVTVREETPADDARIAYRSGRTSAPDPIADKVLGEFIRLDATTLGGWALAPAFPDRRLVVEIWLEGVFLQAVRADNFVPELRTRFGSDGCHGFICRIPDWAVAERGMASAYLSNTNHVIGTPVTLDASDNFIRKFDVPGNVRWLGGLRLSGWAYDRSAPQRHLRVYAYCDDTLIGEAVADRIYEPQQEEPVPAGPYGFDLHLSTHLADGKLHRVRVVEERGTELAGSPLVVGSLGSGLPREFDEKPTDPGYRRRLEFFERLFPSSLPLDTYGEWANAYGEEPAPSVSGAGPRFAIVVIGEADAMAATIASIENGSFDNWLVIAVDEPGHLTADDWQAIGRNIRDEEADRVIALRAGDVLHPRALAYLAAAIEADPSPGIIYADSETVDADGSVVPSFKPAFDLTRLRTQGYAADIAAFVPELLPRLELFQQKWTPLLRPELRKNKEIEHFRDSEKSGNAPYPDSGFSAAVVVAGSFAAAIDGGRTIAHLPQVLVTVPERDAEERAAELSAAAQFWPGGTAEVVHTGGRPSLRLRPRLDTGERVSILIPTRDRVGLLRACIASIRARTDWPNYDITVMDNDSSEPETLAYLGEIARDGVTVLRCPGPFNYARINNLAAHAATGSWLLLLNNDTECTDSGWLAAMLEAGHDGDVGAVGAKLVWPSGTVQHGGVVLGPYFGALHAFNDCAADDPGYDGLLTVCHEVSAVTAACLLVRREDYLTVGGLDERLFPINFNDVDFCLKLRAAGKRNVWTPHASLLHRESASRGRDVGAERTARAARELRSLQLKWGEALIADPYYSPCLNLDAYPYSGLAWPPRPRAARLNLPPQPASVERA